VNSRNSSFFVYFLLLVAIGAMLYVGLRNDSNAAEPLTISRVAQQVQNGQISRIIVEGDDVIRVITTNGTEAESRKETATTLVEQLLSFGVTFEQLAKVDIEVEAPSAWGGVLSGACLWAVCCGLFSVRRKVVIMPPCLSENLAHACLVVNIRQ
jgi:ATP-dependent Zn protease